MPWMKGMPMDADELAAYQQDDFETIREHFAAAGIVVEVGE
jgi:hypothetical protein